MKAAMISGLFLIIITNAKDDGHAERNQLARVVRSSGSASEGFQLSALQGKQMFTSREPFVLQLALRNTTRKVLPLAVSSPEKDYEVTVKDKRGEKMSLTEYGQKIRDTKGDHLSRAILRISPGQELRYEYPVSAIYRMAAGGSYYITARRNVFRENGKGMAEVVSNTIKVTVASN